MTFSMLATLSLFSSCCNPSGYAFLDRGIISIDRYITIEQVNHEKDSKLEYPLHFLLCMN
ncbi:hypothetical protein H5410_022922 [Solanum commersonii]|uniref:Lipoprotein n=1 Tax=Solanum commersonii TaxID=4109 RepID=A0A9J5ZFE7_SOLCO|nr:hypothetical protein H5410_022922 [Solanum commersonii]